MSKLSKAALHIKHRATRIKTYLGMIVAALSQAIPYLTGTDWLEPTCKVMGVCAIAISLMGGSNAGEGNAAPDDTAQ